MSKARDILGTDRDNEFLQSFVRVGLKSDEEDTTKKSVYSQQPKQAPAAPGGGTGGGGTSGAAARKRGSSGPGLMRQTSEARSDGQHSRPSRASLQMELNAIQQKNRQKRKEYFDEVYTDKDRAAAVSFGRVWRLVVVVVVVQLAETRIICIYHPEDGRRNDIFQFNKLQAATTSSRA